MANEAIKADIAHDRDQRDLKGMLSGEPADVDGGLTNPGGYESATQAVKKQKLTAAERKKLIYDRCWF